MTLRNQRIIVYSDTKIDGLNGKDVVYATPLYALKPIENAKLVYTDKEKIKMLYKNIGIEVKKLPKQKGSKDGN